MEQNKINLVEKKNTLYIDTFKKAFNVSEKELNNLRTDFKKLYILLEEQMVEADVKTKSDEWITRQLNELIPAFNRNLLHHYKIILSKSNCLNDLNTTKITNLVTLLREYSLFLLNDQTDDNDRLPEKIMFVDKFQTMKDDYSINLGVKRVKKLIKAGLEYCFNLEEMSESIIKSTKSTLGIKEYDKIMNLDLQIKGLVDQNVLETNFLMNSKNNNSYYDSDNDITYFLQDKIYLKTFGKYNSIAELNKLYPNLDEEIKDTAGINKLISDPRQPWIYEGGIYYYSFNNEFYKSYNYYSPQTLEFEFNELRDNLTRISTINDKKYPNLITVTETKPLANDANEVRDLAKTNVLKVLDNIKNKELSAELKTEAFSLIKNNLKTYVEATQYELDNLPWYKRMFKFIIKPIYNSNVDNLKTQVKQGLRLTNYEFNEAYNSKYTNYVFELEKDLSNKIENVKTDEFELAKYTGFTIDDNLVNEDLDHNIEVNYNISKDEMEIELDKKVGIEIDELNESQSDLDEIHNGMNEKDENSKDDISSSK